MAVTSRRALLVDELVRGGASSAKARRAYRQAAWAARWWRCSLVRLCVAQISRHSDLRRESAALEAIDPAVELGVPEDRLDQRLAAPIQRLAEIGLQDGA